MNEYEQILDELEFSIAEEGINRDVMKLKRAYMKDVKSLVKGIKTSRKTGDYASAIKGCDAGIVLVKKFKDEIKSYTADDQSGVEVFCGTVLRNVQGIGMGLMALVPILGIKAIGDMLKATIEDLNTTITALKNAIKGTGKVSDWNHYVKSAEKALDNYAVFFTRMKKKLEDEKSNTNVSRSAAGESFGIDDFCEMGMSYQEAIAAYEASLLID